MYVNASFIYVFVWTLLDAVFFSFGRCFDEILCFGRFGH